MREVVANHYDVLGLTPEASFDDIKRAYYVRARAFHPDAHAGSSVAVLEEAQRAMSELNAAWTILRDRGLRDEYDTALAVAPPPEPIPARRRPPTKQPYALVGQGFRHWMGPALLTRGRLNLSVDRHVADLAPLRQLAPDRLWGLHAEESRVGDAQLAHLQAIHGLQLLDLSGTTVGDAGLVYLLGLPRLETLSLWATAVTDAGLELVGRLPSLRFLGLGRTRITDAGLAHLRPLTGLRILQLWGTGVDGAGLVHLHGLRQLEVVSLPRRVGSRHRRRLRRALPGTIVD